MRKPTEQCKSDLERLGLDTCAYCGDLMHQDDADHVVYYDDDDQQHTKSFCGHECKVNDYVWRVRKGGL